MPEVLEGDQHFRPEQFGARSVRTAGSCIGAR